MTTKWRGVLLYGGLLAASTATFALRTIAFADHTTSTAAVTGPPRASSSSPSSSPSSDSSSGAPSESSSSSATTTVTGDTVQTRYGPIQVRVTFTGDQITGVETLQQPDSDGKSQRISDFAIPQLRAEVLSSQSADIDTVSGATYTSDGYAQSVQSAIDQH